MSYVHRCGHSGCTPPHTPTHIHPHTYPHFRICAFGHIPGYLINTWIEARDIVLKRKWHLWWWRLKPWEKMWATEQSYDKASLSQATSCLVCPVALPPAPPGAGKTFPYLWWYWWPVGLYWLSLYELALAEGIRMTLWPVLPSHGVWWPSINALEDETLGPLGWTQTRHSKPDEEVAQISTAATLLLWHLLCSHHGFLISHLGRVMTEKGWA